MRLVPKVNTNFMSFSNVMPNALFTTTVVRYVKIVMQYACININLPILLLFPEHQNVLFVSTRLCSYTGSFQAMHRILIALSSNIVSSFTESVIGILQQLGPFDEMKFGQSHLGRLVCR